MRNYIYFDSNILNSYWAQINAGLTRNIITENQRGSSESDMERKEVKLFFPQEEVKTEVVIGDHKTVFKERRYRKYEDKIMHDNIYDEVIKHLNKRCLIRNDNPSTGDHILTEREIDYIDLETARPLLNEAEHIRLDALKASLINKRFIWAEELFIMLDIAHMRDEPDIYCMKYGGMINVLGIVTNIMALSKIKHDNFLELLIFKIIKSNFKSRRQKLYVIHPIALYYEGKSMRMR